MNHKDLKPFQKIILFAFVSLVMGLPQEIRKLMILNIGLDFKFMRLIILLIAVLYIIHRNFIKRTFKAPHLISFLLLIGSFYLFETLPSREGIHNFVFLKIYGEIYVLFLMLVNFEFHNKKIVFYKVIDYAFYSGLIFCLIYWVGHLGLIDVQTEELSLREVLYERRTTVVTYQNIIAYLCAFTILLLIIKQLNENKFTIRFLCRDICYLFLLNGMIIVQASRGGALLSMSLTISYIYILLKYGLKQEKKRHILVSLILILSLISYLFIFSTPFIGKNISSSLIYKRSERVQEDLRIINAVNAWNNFLEHPILGVGYVEAAKGSYVAARSNNEYLQMLASVGFIGFIVYIYYNFRLVAFRIRLLKIPEIALCVFFYAISQLFERPMNFVAIIGYVAFYFYYNSKSTYTEKSRQLAA